ncbi:hypothetical protein PDESU_03883 [Pontiella desulfatans]|uniref:Porin O n=1 Tax=Pontiella desulfatans TaxID=2750659 RepID=A0A6C2U6Z8_PONDE|nr:hypothetical protein [Pontiella desulfatans]VGO15301.1 hypothetical protein PDESU_03883 [Pontiella desulfatans]
MKHQAVKHIGVIATVAILAGSALAQNEERLKALEAEMANTQAELAALKGERNDLAAVTQEESKLRFGGYGEIHANWVEGGNDLLDIHRLVMYMGLDFNDWIKLSSEIELEHASTDEEYLLIEQLYVDFLFADSVNIRAGRVLAPLGIVNQNHEPTLFNGVERPNVEKYIIPSTWMLDGVGLFGSPLSWLNYEIYATAGLNESGFNGKEGVRGGRMKGRPGLNEGALSGRIDVFPLMSESQDLRLGFSGYYGGTDNKNKGGSNSNTNNVSTDNTFTMVSADFEYNLSRVHLRGVVALGENSDSSNLNAAYEPTDGAIGEQIFGWYLEAGADVLPAAWKTGKLKDSSLIPFVRYEEYDTQHSMADGDAADAKYDRSEITLGASWLLTRNLVLKGDVQFCDTAASGSTTKYNLGMGWVIN